MNHETERTIERNDAAAVLIPVFNNERTIETVVRGAIATGLPVLVVDDAATDRTPEILERLRRDGLVFDLVRCPENRGKAGALRLGFEVLSKQRRTIALSVDADLQHDLDLLPDLRSAANPGELVVGCRWPLHPEQPRRNLIGRTVSNIAIRLQSGVSIGDAPCGFRAWPLELVGPEDGTSGRYAWEQEMITRLAWRGAAIRSIDVPAIYHRGDDRVSHYRFGRDWPEGIAIYLWLLVIALIPIPRPGWRTRFTRRLSRLLSPGPLRGDRPEIRTNRWSGTISLVLGGIVATMAPASPWILGAVAWVGWRWHMGFAAILLAGHASLGAIVGPGVDTWFWPAIVAWVVGGLLRPARRTSSTAARNARDLRTLVDPAG